MAKGSGIYKNTNIRDVVRPRRTGTAAGAATMYATFDKLTLRHDLGSVSAHRTTVHPGDVISFMVRWGSDDHEFDDTHLGKVIGLALTDGIGRPYAVPRLAVLMVGSTLDFAFEVHVEPERVTAVLPPDQRALLRWLLSDDVPSPEIALRASDYGSLSSRFIEHALDDEGRLVDPYLLHQRNG